MGKWEEFEKGTHYHIVDLGRPAVFFIPVKKLGKRIEGKTIRQKLHKFLVRNFSAYTISKAPSIGFWRGVSGKNKSTSDVCAVYEVSFLGKHQIPILLQKLAWIAKIIGEECIYFKAGQYTCLVYPKPTPSS